MLLKDKVALELRDRLITLGWALPVRFAREGAKVIVHSRHEEGHQKNRWRNSPAIILPLTLPFQHK